MRLLPTGVTDGETSLLPRTWQEIISSHCGHDRGDPILHTEKLRPTLGGGHLLQVTSPNVNYLSTSGSMISLPGPPSSCPPPAPQLLSPRHSTAPTPDPEHEFGHAHVFHPPPATSLFQPPPSQTNLFAIPGMNAEVITSGAGILLAAKAQLLCLLCTQGSLS